jgi:hypothetical protein
MAARSERLYKDAPSLKRDEKSGKVAVTKSPKPAEKTSTGTDGLKIETRHANERNEVHTRHVGEHMSMHGRHETEISLAQGGDGLKDITERHETEHGDMQKRHHVEFKALLSKQLTERSGGEGSKETKTEGETPAPAKKAEEKERK